MTESVRWRKRWMPVASVWIRTRPTKDGGKRYRLEYRLGGRESRSHYGGSFRTMREAKIRRDWIAGELAALRVPDLARLRDPAPSPTLAEAARRWQESRVDVAEATRLQHRTALRKPLLVLDATGMRLGELERLAWGDVDEPRGRWRVSQAVSKTGRGRWVHVPQVIFEAVLELLPREDRTPDRRVFQGFGGDRFRTAIARACTAAGVPAFSPHDLRHRRISLEHLRGVPWARIGELVGQRNLAVTANTYTHVLTDETELDYEVLLGT